MLFRRWRRDPGRADAAEVDEITRAWVRACEGAGLVREVDTVTGPTVIAPKLTHVVLGPPRVLTVKLQPGQTVDDVRALARRLAPHLGCRGLRVAERGHGEWAVVTLLDEDPLDVHVELAAGDAVLLGRDEDGAAVELAPADIPHAVVQGVTRSGKSVWTYSLLAQVAHRPDVIVAGCDPTGLLFRPFTGSRHAEWQASGLTDVEAHESALARVVDEMDARIGAMPADRDTTPVGPDCPLVVVVLEEYPGLLRVLDAAATRDDKPGVRVRALVSRLLAEGAKAGVRVVILAQRAEASVVGALERAQCSLRISFRVDNRASVELLHPGADPTVADQHTTALPGVALVSLPGRPLTRVRGPFLGGYPEYVAAVQHPESGATA